MSETCVCFNTHLLKSHRRVAVAVTWFTALTPSTWLVLSSVSVELTSAAAKAAAWAVVKLSGPSKPVSVSADEVLTRVQGFCVDSGVGAGVRVGWDVGAQYHVPPLSVKASLPMLTLLLRSQQRYLSKAKLP